MEATILCSSRQSPQSGNSQPLADIQRGFSSVVDLKVVYRGFSSRVSCSHVVGPRRVPLVVGPRKRASEPSRALPVDLGRGSVA